MAALVCSDGHPKLVQPGQVIRLQCLVQRLKEIPMYLGFGEALDKAKMPVR